MKFNDVFYSDFEAPHEVDGAQAVSVKSNALNVETAVADAVVDELIPLYVKVNRKRYKTITADPSIGTTVGNGIVSPDFGDYDFLPA